MSVEPADDAVTVPYPPVWVTDEFSSTGTQRISGFVEKAAEDRVYAQFVHMGFPHQFWVRLDRMTHRVLRRR